MRAMKSKQSVILTLLVLLSALPMSASRPIERQLASLSQVKLSLPNGLGYEPIPGLDRAELRRQIGKLVTGTLAARGIEVNSEAQARLFISLNKERNDCQGKEFYAIAGNIRLVERARLERHVDGKDGAERIYVTTWNWPLLVISTADTVLEDILDEVEYAVQIFADDVAAARWHSEHD